MARLDNVSDEFLPSTYLAVLIIIAGGAEYGYQVNSIIEKFGYREWVELQFSSIYKALSELEKRGLIIGKKDDAHKKTSKKTYRLTKKGRATLQQQIKMCLSNPPRPKTMFDLGVSAMSFLTQEEVLEALATHKTNLEQGLNFLELNVRNLDNLERLRREAPESRVGKLTVEEYNNAENTGAVRALFDRPAMSVCCQIAWLDSFIKQIKRGEGFIFKDTSRR